MRMTGTGAWARDVERAAVLTAAGVMAGDAARGGRGAEQLPDAGRDGIEHVDRLEIGDASGDPLQILRPVAVRCQQGDDRADHPDDTDAQDDPQERALHDAAKCRASGVWAPVAPPFEDYDGVGFRVPLLVISPYAKKGFVSHTQFETASVLRFAEDLFGLPHMAAADTRAASPTVDCFDFARQPRAFVPINAPYSAQFFIRHRFADGNIAPDYE